MKISWIEPDFLAASGIPLDKKDLVSLKNQGICAIITLTEYPLTKQKEITNKLFDELDITPYHIPIVDHQPPKSVDVVDELKSIIDGMRMQSKPVLVHGHAGIGRTGTMLHAYYLASELSLDEAKQKIKLVRPMSQFFMLSNDQQKFLEQFAQAQSETEVTIEHQQPIMASAIDHICLMVSDLQVARAYYQSIFGLTVSYHPSEKNIWLCETEHIHFFIEKVDFPREYLSRQHLSLRVPDVQTIMNTLQSQDIPFESGTFTEFEYHNYHWVEWRDPDGIRLECIELI